MAPTEEELERLRTGLNHMLADFVPAAPAAPAAPAGPAIEPNLPTQRAALPAATAAGLIYLGATAGEPHMSASPKLLGAPAQRYFQFH